MPASSLLADASLSSALTSFGVIALAELGDKSQLVCMTLAARHPARPVSCPSS
jgi:putative Ca2+/H+ antiporter (TMEM165/GDT1 family)